MMNPIHAGDEWIKKPFFGDWDDLRATANQWRALAESLSALQSAVRRYPVAGADESVTFARLRYPGFAMDPLYAC